MGRPASRSGSGIRSGEPAIDTLTTSAPSDLRKGRERTCDQCGTVYRSIRSNSRFCSSPCRVSRHRGHDPRKGEVLLKCLAHLGFIGPVGPWNVKNPRPVQYALLVPVAHALSEINSRYKRSTTVNAKTASRTLAEALAATPSKACPDITERDFRTTLRKLDIEVS